MTEKPKQTVFVIQGDMLAQWKQTEIESASKDDVIQTQQGIIKSQRMENRYLKGIVEEKNETIKRDWDKLKKALQRTEQLLLTIVRRHPGLTHAELVIIFQKTYGFQPVVDNKLRSLRKQGLVFSQPDPTTKLLTWYPTSLRGVQDE